eukprot:PhM_4_TR13279/c1_g1_i1/m.105810
MTSWSIADTRSKHTVLAACLSNVIPTQARKLTFSTRVYSLGPKQNSYVTLSVGPLQTSTYARLRYPLVHVPSVDHLTLAGSLAVLWNLSPADYTHVVRTDKMLSGLDVVRPQLNAVFDDASDLTHGAPLRNLITTMRLWGELHMLRDGGGEGADKLGVSFLRHGSNNADGVIVVREDTVLPENNLTWWHLVLGALDRAEPLAYSHLLDAFAASELFKKCANNNPSGALKQLVENVVGERVRVDLQSSLPPQSVLHKCIVSTKNVSLCIAFGGRKQVAMESACSRVLAKYFPTFKTVQGFPQSHHDNEAHNDGIQISSRSHPSEKKAVSVTPPEKSEVLLAADHFSIMMPNREQHDSAPPPSPHLVDAPTMSSSLTNREDLRTLRALARAEIAAQHGCRGTLVIEGHSLFGAFVASIQMDGSALYQAYGATEETALEYLFARALPADKRPGKWAPTNSDETEVFFTSVLPPHSGGLIQLVQTAYHKHFGGRLQEIFDGQSVSLIGEGDVVVRMTADKSIVRALYNCYHAVSHELAKDMLVAEALPSVGYQPSNRNVIMHPHFSTPESALLTLMNTEIGCSIEVTCNQLEPHTSWAAGVVACSHETSQNVDTVVLDDRGCKFTSSSSCCPTAARGGAPRVLLATANASTKKVALRRACYRAIEVHFPAAAAKLRQRLRQFLTDAHRPLKTELPL